jgi:hypothetical protein
MKANNKQQQTFPFPKITTDNCVVKEQKFAAATTLSMIGNNVSDSFCWDMHVAGIEKVSLLRRIRFNQLGAS